MLTGTCGCKPCTTVTLYGSFVAVAAYDFEMPVSYTRRFSDLCGVCSKIAPTLFSFSSVCIRFLANSLSRSDPVDLTFLNKFMDALGLEPH
jgi:hypothetical protein